VSSFLRPKRSLCSLADLEAGSIFFWCLASSYLPGAEAWFFPLAAFDTLWGVVLSSAIEAATRELGPLGLSLRGDPPSEAFKSPVP